VIGVAHSKSVITCCLLALMTEKIGRCVLQNSQEFIGVADSKSVISFRLLALIAEKIGRCVLQNSQFTLFISPLITIHQC
ncbi:unnamed protein product, partial [Rotaria magnacalcarata]